MQPPPSLLEALRWYVEAGVDETIGETPVDRFSTATAATAPAVGPAAGPGVAAPGPRVGSPSAPAMQHPAMQHPAGPAGTWAPPPGSEPRQIASPPGSGLAPALGTVAARTLAELRQEVERFEGCRLKATATTTVFGAGTEGARLMLIGEAPGAEEDRRGVPFVGVSGQLLDRMLATIGLDRDQVYITNTIYWRPPGNRTPTPAESASCLPFLVRQIELVAPRILVLVGGAAAKTLLNRSEGIMRLRGRWFEYRSSESGGSVSTPIPARATFHPAYLLRSPGQKREAWRDLLAIRQKLDEIDAVSG